MLIERIKKDDRTKLIMALDKYTKSFSKRGISFVALGHTAHIGSITVLVSGKKGVVQKEVIVIYDESEDEWNAYCDGYKYNMLALSEIGMVVKNIVNKMSILLGKV